MKRSVKMRGFMCQDPTATAMCMASDPRSMIVPRRTDRTLAEHASLIANSNKYARIVESRRFGSASKRPTTSVPFKQNNQKIMDKDQKAPHMLPSVASSDVFQVVVMRVSLHCQGCAGKVKKHLSKMEGVTSFSIDLENKRVTVRGHVSPVGVLESISKVKRAEFWPC